MRGGAVVRLVLFLLVVAAVGTLADDAFAATFFFSTGSPNGLIAFGSRPSTTGQEIEAGDDFVLTDATSLSGATFSGLLPSAAPLSGIQQVRIEVYRVFPSDSDSARTPLVPTRTNSPADSALTVRDSAAGGLSFTATLLNPSFFANNSVLTGIHPKPNQTTGGEGPVSGEEATFTVSFTPGLNLPAGHYFFVPQVKLASGDFLWLSAPKPITAPGTPFPAGSADIQAWIRNTGLEPDWLRIGTDIVGGATPPTYNGTFSLSGTVCQPIALSPASLPGATQGQAYSVSLSASGGAAPYSFGETGALPAGLALDPGGTLAGTPADSGSFPVTLTATDANGCTGSGDATLAVAAAPAGAAPIEPVTPAAPGASPLPPAVTSARLSPRAFRAAPRGATLARAKRVPVGTTVRYVDSQSARTTFTVLRPAAGHRRGSKCAAGRPRRHQKRCTRWVPVGSAGHVDVAGSVKVHFSGRIRRRTLRPGAYHLTLVPRANGLAGRAVTLAFRIVR
ncbi:MAG TPA: Ig domain-containing protein [Thermoleophilaceae bacterium]|nr:Ig domain-containing protein [Thermoleophilaceae bacterium]